MMNNTTQRAIVMLTDACVIAGIANPEVFPAEPVSCYDGAQIQIGTNTVNFFLQDDEPGNSMWCLEVTREDGTYDRNDDINAARLCGYMREIVKASGEKA